MIDWWRWQQISEVTHYRYIRTRVKEDWSHDERPSVALIKILKCFDEKCISALYLYGHGCSGAGFVTGTYDPDGPNEHNAGIAFDVDGDSRWKLTNEEADLISQRLCPGAVINFCSCSSAYDQEKLKRIAKRFQAKICGCDSTIYSPCRCVGKWICASPDGTIQQELYPGKMNRGFW